MFLQYLQEWWSDHGDGSLANPKDGILVKLWHVLAHLAKHKVATVLGPGGFPPLLPVIIEPRIIDQNDSGEISTLGWATG